MKRGYPPVWLGAVLLALALFWNLLGAPIGADMWGDMKASFAQARILLPSRLGRVLWLWLPAQTEPEPAEPLREAGMDADERALEKLAPEAQTINVYMPSESNIVTLPLESYVCGVVAAEMPAAYHLQALGAQAVAARTRALYQRERGGCKAHPGADICADSGCCQGYADAAACKAKWGEEYEVYRARIVEAVSATADELLTSGGEPILVMYHAMSGGTTENVQAVFSQSLPYLVSVESAGEEGARGYLTDTSYSFEEAAALLEKHFGDVTADDVRRTLTIGGHTSTGRVDTVLLGGRELPATEVRKALGLRSTWFTLTADANGVTFHQRGYGHGVGMSQVGANAMAANGADYRAILAHYYPGTSLEQRSMHAGNQ